MGDITEHHPKILLVDDEDGVRGLCSRLLKNWGFAVSEARSGEEALLLAATRGGCFDLLVTDVVMPGISGVELAKRLRAAQPQVRILFISGYASEPLNGFEDACVLAKPFAPAILKAAVNEALTRAAKALGIRAPSARKSSVLVVEDNHADARLIQEALRDGAADLDVFHSEDGQDALTFLSSTDRPRPDFILLDLNLPGINGQEVLKEIRANPALRHMPVIILSGSGEAADINTAYENRANCYVKKRFDHREMKAAIVDIRNFWLRHAAVPASISN